jgi:hypothetical protein
MKLTICPRCPECGEAPSNPYDDFDGGVTLAHYNCSECKTKFSSQKHDYYQNIKLPKFEGVPSEIELPLTPPPDDL